MKKTKFNIPISFLSNTSKQDFIVEQTILYISFGKINCADLAVSFHGELTTCYLGANYFAEYKNKKLYIRSSRRKF